MWNHDADPSDFLPINDRVQLIKVRVTVSRATIFLHSSHGFRLMPDAGRPTSRTVVESMMSRAYSEKSMKS